MSRTYRTKRLPLDCNCGAPYGWKGNWRYKPPTEAGSNWQLQQSRRKGVVPDRFCLCRTNRKYDYSKRNHERDSKDREHSSRKDKKVYSRSRRAKVKNAMRHGDYDKIPIFPRSDNWFRWRDW